MPLFGRRHHDSGGSAPDDESRFTESAAAHGLQPAATAEFDPDLQRVVNETAYVLYGLPAHNEFSATYSTHFHDTFRTDRDGRSVVVANGWTNVNPGGRAQDQVKGVAVCVVELPSILALASVQPRRLKHPVVRGLPETPTGDASFDEQFRVVTAPVLGAIPVTPEMQRLIMAHDDWSFRTERYRFACVRKDPFDSVEEMVQRIDEVLAIVAAIPSSVLPDRVDHSQDDLVARIAELDSVDDALEFLQHLTAGDREQLARSNTPLAAFADVTTPEEAIARFQAMDQGHQMQLLAMFERVADDHNS